MIAAFSPRELTSTTWWPGVWPGVSRVVISSVTLWPSSMKSISPRSSSGMTFLEIVGRGGQDFGLREVFPVLARAEVSRPGEVGLVGGTGAVDIPTDVVLVQVGVDDDIHVVRSDALSAQLAEEVAGTVIEVGVRARTHAGVDQHSLPL